MIDISWTFIHKTWNMFLFLKLVFAHLNNFLDLPYLHLPYLVQTFFIRSSFVTTKSCKSCGLIASFTHFRTLLGKWGVVH